MVTLNCYSKEQRQSVISRIERYSFSEKFNETKLHVIELEGEIGL